MHIAFLITRADAVGGATIHVRDLARSLAQHGCRATVLVGGEGPVTEEFQRYGIAYQSLRWLSRAIHPLRDALATAEIARVLRRLRPDLVSLHTSKAGLVGRVAATLAGVPSVYTPHGWTVGDRISPAAGKVFTLAERMAAPLSKRIINVCEEERSLALRKRIAPAAQLAVVHNGMPDVAAHLRAVPGRQPARIVCVARFEAPKDHATLIESLALIGHMPWEAEFIGEGPLEEAARQLVEARGLANRIRFAGVSAKVADRLAAGQLFVLPTLSEGFPRSILEAMRAGLPAVASDVGGVREAIVDGITGTVVPRSDAAAMASALAQYVADPACRETRGAAGRSRYESMFTFDRMLARTLRVYEEILPANSTLRALVPLGGQ